MTDISENLGKIHLYAGDGKGKTTAATGLAVRASGYGLKVLFAQFLKSGNSAELKQLEKLGITIVSGQPVTKFSFQMTEAELKESKVFFGSRLQEIFNQCLGDGFNLLILDEILGAIQAGLIDEDELIFLMKGKPAHLELVLTGRNPSDDLIKLADYYSEIVMRKHPFVKEGLMARPGIEY